MKALKTYLKSRKKALLSLLEKPIKKYVPETFHQLRVEIKKLNALFDLLDFSCKKLERKKMIKPFKAIFRQAGKVRELQIEEATFKKYIQDDLLIEYRTKLIKRQDKEKKLFFALLNDKTKTELKKKYDKIIPFLSKIEQDKVEKYMLMKEAEIKDFLAQPHLEIEQLHELRKLLKIYYYNQTSLFVGNHNQLNTKKAPLTELLGQWNDGVVIIDHLDKIIKKAKINLEEIALLESLRTKIATENYVLLDQIKLAIPQSELSQ